MADTLILNADYNPLSIIPISSITWKDAVKIMYLGHANVIEWYDRWEVHSPSTTLRVPSVMISETYIKKKHHVKFSRANLLLRDNFTCQYCGDKLGMQDLTIDHVIPRVRGGVTSWTNVTSSCYTCNTIKGHKSHMKPRTKPVKPDYYQLLENARKTKITVPDAKWLPYLAWDPDFIRVASPRGDDLT